MKQKITDEQMIVLIQGKLSWWEIWRGKETEKIVLVKKKRRWLGNIWTQREFEDVGIDFGSKYDGKMDVFGKYETLKKWSLSEGRKLEGVKDKVEAGFGWNWMRELRIYMI